MKLRSLALRLLAPAILMTGIPLGVQEAAYWTKYALDIRPLQGSMRTYLRTYLDDQKLLAEEPTFAPTRGTRNAAGLLNPKLDWVMGTDVVPSPERQLTTAESAILLSGPTRERLRRWGANFARFHSQIDYGAIDFAWMTQALAYDYWDIHESYSVEESFERRNALGLYFTQTMAPAFEDFTFLAKLRLMKGLHEGRLDTAVKEVRHFARLLYTTETLMGALAAIAILRAELAVSDYLEGTIQTHFIEWKPLERSLIDRARRAALATNAYFTLFTPEETLTKVFAESGSRVGLCSGIAKGMLRAMLVRPLLEPQVWGERDFSGTYSVLDTLVVETSGRCRLRLMKELWDHGNSRQVWLGLYGRNSWDWINLHLVKRIPYARKAWGLDLSSAFLSNGLESYRQTLE